MRLKVPERGKGPGVRALLGSSAALLVAIGCSGPGPRLHVPTPPHARYTAVNLNALHAVSPNDYWIAGDLTTYGGLPEGFILWTDDAGKKWHRAASEVHDLCN